MLIQVIHGMWDVHVEFLNQPLININKLLAYNCVVCNKVICIEISPNWKMTCLRAKETCLLNHFKIPIRIPMYLQII
jgi:hypothetical protein